jgi:hypothetical protein
MKRLIHLYTSSCDYGGVVLGVGVMTDYEAGFSRS